MIHYFFLGAIFRKEKSVRDIINTFRASVINENLMVVLSMASFLQNISSSLSQPELISSYAELFSSLIWPIIFLFIFFYLLLKKDVPRRLRNLFKTFKSIKMFGSEFVLSEELSDEIGKDAEEAFEFYRKQVNREYDRLVEIYDIRQKLESVINSKDVIDALGKDIEGIKDIPGFRCTIHVPDILFRETIYQLLDYYPRGKGRSRTWSIRFGIIGRAWRLRKSETQGNVPTEHNELILEWGMTLEEAAASGQGRQSFVCIVLKNTEGINGEGTAVGIFYLDSTQEKLFGANDKDAQQKLHQAIFNGCIKSGLTSSLEEIKMELKSRSPLIKING